MRKSSLSQTDSGTWAASTTVATDLERVGLVTRIDFTVEITPSATLKGANQTDGLFRVIQNMRVLGGSHTYMTLPSEAGGHPGTLWHYLMKVDGHGEGHTLGGITAPHRTFVPMNFVFHPGTRPRDLFGRDNPFDLSAFVPASQEAQLRCEWVTGPNSVLDDSVTISSAVLRITLHRVIGSKAEIAEEMKRQGVITPPGANGMVPAWSGRVLSPVATASDFSLEEDIPLGAYLKRIGILAQDATATRPVRSSDELTQIALKLEETTERIFQVNTSQITAHLPQGTILELNEGISITTIANTDFGGHAPHGVYPLDLRAHSQSALGRDYGLNLQGLQSGSVKLQMTLGTNASGDDLLILYERYMPYRGELAKF